MEDTWVEGQSQMCHGQGCRRYIGDGKNPTFDDGILISWVYKPLRNWVDDHTIGSWDSLNLVVSMPPI